MTVRRTCYALAGLLVLSGLVHLGVLLTTHGSWYGPVSWRKPFTFGLSFGVTLATVAWLSSYVRVRGWVLGAFAGACVLEVTLITVQAWRRTPSHFNLSTPLDGLVARTLAVGGAVLVGVIAVLTVSSFRRPATAPSLRVALRAGLVILDLSMLSGAAMIAIGTTRVLGGDQAGAYRAGAQLKPLHGATMHAVLVLPLLAVLLQRFDLPEARRVQAVWAAIGLYAIAAAGFTLLE